MCCFTPLGLWSLVTAAVGSGEGAALRRRPCSASVGVWRGLEFKWRAGGCTFALSRGTGCQRSRPNFLPAQAHSFCRASFTLLRFLQEEGKTLHQQKDPTRFPVILALSRWSGPRAAAASPRSACVPLPLCSGLVLQLQTAVWAE